jgi:murein DD-endopeptidase MepM/ murein hydrolase activator NlpD
MEVAKVVARLAWDVEKSGAEQYEKKQKQLRAEAKKPIVVELGVEEKDKQVWQAYNKKIEQTQKTLARRERFQAKLGVNFDKRAFNAAERELNKLQRQTEHASRSGSTHMRNLSSGIRTGSFAMVKHLAGPIAAFTSLAGTIATLKKSVDTVETLAKGTGMLSRTTGLDTKTSSEWVSVAKTRGVEAKALNMGFISLSKNIKAATDGGEKQASKLSDMAVKQKRLTEQMAAARKENDPERLKKLTEQYSDLQVKIDKTSTSAGKQADSFAELGVSQDMLKRGDVNEIVGQLAEGFSKLPDGAHKATIAQQLFSRQSQTLLPLLNKGSDALKEQLGLVDKYGATLDEKGVKSAMKAVAAQRELKLAWQGVQIFLGTKLIPIITAGTRAIADFVLGMKEGTGWGGKLVKGLEPVINTVKNIWKEITDLIERFKQGDAAAVALVAALAGLGAAVATIKAIAAVTKAWAVAQAALSAAMNANPISLIIIAVAALGAAMFVAYKKSETFRKVVDGAFHGIKAAAEFVFPLIKKAMEVGFLGPLPFIITHLKEFAHIVGAIFGALRKAVIDFADGYLGMVTTVLGGVQKMAEVASHLPGVGSKFKALGEVIGKVRDKVDGWREDLRKLDGRQKESGDASEAQRKKVEKLHNEYDTARERQKKLKKGTEDYRDAAKDAAKKADELAHAIAGVRSTATGAKKPVDQLGRNIDNLAGVSHNTAAIIAADINAVLKEIGAKPITVKLSSGTSALGRGTTLGGFPQKATGGALAGGGIPHAGSGSRDDHMLVAPGGRVVAAMSGTEGILNTPQMNVVDYALGGMASMGMLPASMGGLDKLWGSGMRHYATGGPLRRYARGGFLQLPADPAGPYHDTDGLPGYPAVDVFASPGTPVGAPVSATVARFSGQAGGPGGGGAYGYSIYLDGENQRSYYLTHFGSRSVRVGQHVRRGQIIGRVADYPGGVPDHIHEGVHGGLTGVDGSGGMVVVPTLEQPKVSGNSPLGVMLAKAIGRKLTSSANRFLSTQSGTSSGGDPGFMGGSATGNGADLMRDISKQRGWNFGDWWALDASETGHGANLANPTSSARLRGQFLDMNYGKYGPGSDPGQHPSMSQQIQSMAQYIAARYGNPSAAWAFHQANNFYGRGGPLRRFAGGGPLGLAGGGRFDKYGHFYHWEKQQAKGEQYPMRKHVGIGVFQGEVFRWERANKRNVAPRVNSPLMWRWRKAWDEGIKTGGNQFAEGGPLGFADGGRFDKYGHFYHWEKQQAKGEQYPMRKYVGIGVFQGEISRWERANKRNVAPRTNSPLMWRWWDAWGKGIKTGGNRFASGGLLAGIPHFKGGGHPANQSGTQSGSVAQGFSLKAANRSVKHRVANYEAVNGSIETLRKDYSLHERRYNRIDDGDLFNETTGELNLDLLHQKELELFGLSVLARRIKDALVKARRIAKRIMETYRDIEKALSASLPHAKKKDRSGIKARIKDAHEGGDEYAGIFGDLKYDVANAKEDLVDLGAEMGALTSMRNKPPEAADDGGSTDSGSSDSGDSGSGDDGSTVTNELTPDQQAQLAQVDNLKSIVARGTFVDTTSAGILGGVTNPNTVGQAAAPSPLAVKAAAMGVNLSGNGATAATSDGMTNINITVQTLHPADPAMLQEVGRAVVSGLGYQGSVNTPRIDLGV